VHVIELPAHHRGQQAAPPVGWKDCDACHPTCRQDSAGYRHLVAKNTRGRHQLASIKKRQRPVELGDAAAALKILSGRRRSAEGTPQGPNVRRELFWRYRPEMQACRSGYR
jgi:hypothetical protein